MFGIKVVRNVISNNIDFHNQPSRMYRSLPRRERYIRRERSNSNIRITGAAGGTSKYYGNIVMWCFFIVFRPLLYEINRSKLKNCFNQNLFQDLLKKILKFVIFSFFNDTAAPEGIIQMTSNHVGMLIRELEQHLMLRLCQNSKLFFIDPP